jgi:hypothetical protein
VYTIFLKEQYRRDEEIIEVKILSGPKSSPRPGALLALATPSTADDTQKTLLMPGNSAARG